MNRHLTLFLITLAFVAASSGASRTAFADDHAAFIQCGDNVVEVNPYATAKMLAGQSYPYPSRNDAFSAPPDDTSYFYNQGNIYRYNPTASWPLKSGEMCDGTDSTVLCDTSVCTLIKQRPNLASECSYSDKLTNTKATCGIGVGNGIIQPGDGFGESCDDGNVVAGDGCSPFGKIELGEDFVPNICGNGVIEAGEVCDDGNTRGGDGCSADCKTTGKDDAGGVCPEVKVGCGNGRVDYALGEQCDGGEDCTKNCVLKASPVFSEDSVAYWKIPTDSEGNVEVFIDTQDASKPTGSKISETIVRSPKELFEHSASIENRGQKVVVPRRANHQFAGVLLSGQNIDALYKEKTSPEYIFKDGKIHFKMVVSMSDTYETAPGEKMRWDDDAFGIVFGMHPGEQGEYSGNNPGYEYLMLSWRSLPPRDWQQAWVYPGCNPTDTSGIHSNNLSLHGPNGLRLYNVKGAPSYTQLWTMSENCTSDYMGNPWKTTGSVKEIRTDTTTDWEMSSNPWTPAVNSWNRVINPFLPLNTFYALDFGIGQEGLDQRLQIDAEFSDAELKVWVNRQLAIHVTRAELEASTDVNWPTSGQVGFYFMGMDNFTIDTSDTYSDIKAFNPDSLKKPASDEPAESSYCHDYCGNGVVESGETCDDGNTDDYDGCDNKCQSSTNTQGGQCHTIDNKTLCYGGAIDRPANGAIVPSSPVVGGTFTGATRDIVVEVKDGSGMVICKGSVSGGTVSKKDGRWTLERCELSDDGRYETTATFIPAQSINGKNFEPTTETATFTLSKKDSWLTVDEPGGDPIRAATDLDREAFQVSGKASDDVKSVKVKVCTKEETPVCGAEEVIVPKDNGAWRGDFPTFPDGCDTAGDECVIIFTPVDAGGMEIADGEVSKEVLLTSNYELPIPKISAPTGNQRVILSADDTVTLQGTVPATGTFGSTCIEDGTFKENNCSKVYVKLTSSCMINKKPELETVIVPMNEDLTYTADVPIAKGCDTVAHIRVWSFDDEGRISNHGGTPVKIAGTRTPIISFTCPTPTNPEATCNLLGHTTESPKTGDGLVVNGQTNIQSQRPVVVKAYKKANPDAPCKIGDLKDQSPDGKVTVQTTNEGKWAADITHLPNGDYCVIAELKSQNDAETIATASTEVAGHNRDDISGTNGADTPFFVDSPTTVAEKTLTTTNNKVPVTVSVDSNSNVVEGDECVIFVEGSTDWNGIGTFVYDDTAGKWLCTADLDAKKGDDSLLGKTLTAVVQQEGKDAPEGTSASSEPLLVPKASMTVNNDGSVTLTLDSGYPVGPGETISVTDDAGQTLGTCVVQPNGQCVTGILTENGQPDGRPVINEDSPTKIFASTPEYVKIAEGEVLPEPLSGTLTYDDQNGKAVVVVDGVGNNNREVVITVTLKDGSTVEKRCILGNATDGRVQCEAGPFNADGKVIKNDDIKDVKVTGPNNTIQPWKPTPKTPSEGKNDEVTIGYDGDSDRVVVTIPKSTADTYDLKDGGTLTLKPDGVDKEIVCTLSGPTTNGDFTCKSDAPFTDENGQKFTDVVVTVSDGLVTIGNPELKNDTAGFVAGGCSTTDAPGSTLLSLLLGLFGFVALRRRRK